MLVDEVFGGCVGWRCMRGEELLSLRGDGLGELEKGVQAPAVLIFS